MYLIAIKTAVDENCKLNISAFSGTITKRYNVLHLRVQRLGPKVCVSAISKQKCGVILDNYIPAVKICFTFLVVAF